MDAPDFGDVHVEGDDAQNLVGNIIGGDVIGSLKQYVNREPSMVLSSAWIEDAVASYVPVANHDLVVGTLERTRAVALAGPDGCGRTVTGLAAVRQLAPGLPIRRFSVGRDDVEGIAGDRPCAYLLRAGDEDPERVHRCVELVRDAKGFLLLAGEPDELPPFVGDQLGVVALAPPSALAVYQRRLMRRGLGSSGLPGWPAAALLLRGATPAEGRRLADIAEAVHRRGGAADEIEQAYRNWTDRLDRWFREHEEPQDRALLIAAAAIAPADEVSVYTAARSLARHLDVRVNGAGLAWRPVRGLAALLGAEKRDRVLEFGPYGFAEAVVPFVLDEYPLTHVDLFSWLAELPTSDITLPRTLRRKLAELLADLAAEHGRDEAITDTAARWAGRGEAELAFVLLSRTCLHPHVGGRVRRALYDWSRTPSLSPQLKETVARTCAVLGEALPSVALTRLKHLATFGDASIRRIAVEVAADLAEREPVLVLHAALDWCGGDGRRRAAGVDLFLALALRTDGYGAPALITSEHTDLTRVAVVWGIALEQPSPAFFAAVALWLDAAVRWPQLGAAVVGTLLSAATAGRPGDALFLLLAERVGPRGAPIVLEHATPGLLADLWAVALARWIEESGTTFPIVAGVWFGAAARRPEVRAVLVDILAGATRNRVIAADALVELVTSWAGAERSRRDVREEFLLRLLEPPWRRLVLKVWIRVRSVLER
ncbi:hypothetical protein [Actinomadura rayongensis]|uniref:Uncharacterized protein n=1 Tax=Actinomadura rayongensis TaxID=1429076 RepID=A0A6I4W864_9ACTN|nr:hypothetical protein [Actinomadura rayongensis]MXQ65473.1 hypothetical protein [Actinomadura rayongensis]